MTAAHLHNRPLLRVYLYYRFLLSALLFSMFFSGAALDVLGASHPQLFWWTSLSYAIISLLTLVAFRLEQLQRSINRIFGFLVIDLVSLLLLLHASGGMESGLGYLFLITVAMGSMFLRMQLALALAALTTLFIIGETAYLAQTGATDGRMLFSAGVLGSLTFATALAFLYLTNKIRVSDTEAAFQAQYADNLQRLAQLIVARMRTGIVVVDAEHKVELINDSALQLLGLADQHYLHQPLKALSPIADLLACWQRQAEPTASRYHVTEAGQEIRINFASLDAGSEARTLLFLEDHRLLAQQAQQLKLASLGRLTASIAHEVRNPLGAISHAAQLLSESPHIHDSDRRLVEIAYQHTQRVNQIVENTLVLSRRRNPNPQLINLNKWLPRFVSEFGAGRDGRLQLSLAEEDVVVRVDLTQLNQVLTNLCDNGLRYSKQRTGEARITVQTGVHESTEASFIAVVDEGPGVDDDKLHQIFEPFFTTDEQGSGLGLYISKELCEINQATLHYKPTPEGKSCFRIDFSHHQRVF